MTIEQAIFQVDELKPNQIGRAQKILWLSRIDQRIFDEIMCTHQGDENTPEHFDGYRQDTPPDTALLAREPYEEIYQYFLEMMIDRANLENDKYNDDAALFDELFGQYARAYHRTHRPLTGQLAHRF